MKIIFLDIDGVLNKNQFDVTAKSMSIDRDCIQHFNEIIYSTFARVVLSSSWRYMIYHKEITKNGFQYLLRTHGAISRTIIEDILPLDEEIFDRAKQIKFWLSNNKVDNFVVLDDLELDVPNFVQINPNTGLTKKECKKAIEILNG